MAFRPLLCPNCRQLVGANDESCFNCGRPHPGRPGIGSLIALLGEDGFIQVVQWGCIALLVCTLVADVPGIEMSGAFRFLSPSARSVFLFGASGVIPVFGYGRWWTVLSAGWLHGGLLHILFNVLWIRSLGPAIVHLYGTSRTIIIYTVASIVGFTASSVAGLLPLPWPLSGAHLTLGASASVFGLFGALLVYGHRGGNIAAREYAKTWIIGGVLIGLMPIGIDNWAHAGGLGAGYLAARLLDPLKPEQEWHARLAVLCLAACLLAVLASVTTGRAYVIR